MHDFRTFLLRLDPRLKIISAFALGILTWQANWAVLGFYLLFVAVLALFLSGYGAVSSKNLRYLAWLVLLWSGIKALWGLWAMQPVEQALFSSLILGQRLAVLVLLGLCLTALCSARQLGLAFDWFLRPVLGAAKSWQAALCLALMLHFLPLSLQTLQGVRQAIFLRCPEAGVYKRFKLLVKTSFRILAHKTWEQTLALSTRGLDQGSAWQEPILFRPMHWLLGLSLVLLAAVLAFSW